MPSNHFTSNPAHATRPITTSQPIHEDFEVAGDAAASLGIEPRPGRGMSAAFGSALLAWAVLTACGHDTRPDEGFGDPLPGDDAGANSGTGGNDNDNGNGNDNGPDNGASGNGAGGAGGNGDSGTAGESGNGTPAPDAGPDLDAGDPIPCDPGCPSAMPVCNDDDVCVQCTADNDSACTDDTPVCDTDANQCVQCLENSDCTDPQAARCDTGTNTCEPCLTNDDCEGITDGDITLGVCDENGDEGAECVECTPTDYEHCGTDDQDRQYVCNSLQRRCSEQREHNQGLCSSCVSDASCELGQRCVMQRFESQDVGHFCVWERDAPHGDAPSTCSLARPFVQLRTNVASIDGETADVCTLATTTCPAHRQFRTAREGCGLDQQDDAACGLPDFDDALCRLFEAGTPDAYNCTVPCSSSQDCRSSHACVTTASDPYCDLQTGTCYDDSDCGSGDCDTNDNTCID